MIFWSLPHYKVDNDDCNHVHQMLHDVFSFTVFYLFQTVQCPAPTNVTLHCPIGVTGVFEDTCIFSCNAGYELQGSNNETCLANQSWSGGDPICEPLKCSNVTMVADDIMSSSCDMTYQSQCTVSCDEGFTGDDVTYLCNVTSDPTMVDWIPIGGVDVMCERGLLV